MKPEHRRSWWENGEFGRGKRWFRRGPRVRARVKRLGHHMDRLAERQSTREETRQAVEYRWYGDENGWRDDD